MKILSTALIPILLATSPGPSPLNQKDDHPRAHSDRYGVNGFGARLVIAENPEEHIREWQKIDIPKIASATDVKRDAPAGAFVVFSGCTQDDRARCNAKVSYTMLEPDGDVFAELQSEPLWRGLASPNLRLGQGFLPFRLGADDPSGEYKIKARVSDLNANISFELETKFRVK